LTKGKQAARDVIKRKRVKARKKGRVPRASQDKRRKVDQEMEVWVNQGWIPLGDRAVPLNEEPRVTKVSFEEDPIQINDRMKQCTCTGPSQGWDGISRIRKISAV